MASLLGTLFAILLFSSPLWISIWLFVRWRNRKAKKRHGEIVSQKEVDQTAEDENSISQSFLQDGIRFRFPQGGTIDITEDEFEGKKELRFLNTGPFGLDKYMFFSENHEQFRIGFRSVDDKNMILFGVLQKEVKLLKGDKVVLLFKDGSREEFLLEEKGYKVDKDDEGVWIESYAILTDEQITKFSELELSKWRLYHSEKVPITGALDQMTSEGFKSVGIAYAYSLEHFYRNNNYIKSEPQTVKKTV